MVGLIILHMFSLFWCSIFPSFSLDSNMQIRLNPQIWILIYFFLHYFHIVTKCTQNKVQHDA
jgi:hypothetical protein